MGRSSESSGSEGSRASTHKVGFGQTLDGSLDTDQLLFSLGSHSYTWERLCGMGEMAWWWMLTDRLDSMERGQVRDRLPIRAGRIHGPALSSADPDRTSLEDGHRSDRTNARTGQLTLEECCWDATDRDGGAEGRDAERAEARTSSTLSRRVGLKIELNILAICLLPFWKSCPGLNAYDEDPSGTLADSDGDCPHCGRAD